MFAGGGPQARAVVGEVYPDTILLDVMMPGMDGTQAFGKLRAKLARGKVPTILATAVDDRDARIRGIESGADDFVSRPLDRLGLRARERTIARLNRYRRLLWERTRRQAAEEKIHKRSQELVLLNSVITAAASTSDLEAVLRQACAALAEAFSMPQATVALFSEDWPEPSLLVRHQSQETQVQPTAAPILSPILLRKETHAPVAIMNAETDPRLAEAHRQLRERGIRSLLIVPIPVQGRVVGSIELAAQQPMEFGEDDFTLATSIATAVGQAVENSRLCRELGLDALGMAETVARHNLELQTERDRTQAILEALGEAVLVADADGTIRYLNPAAESLTGFRSEELIGQEWDLWQCDPMATELHTEARTAAQKGQRWSGETLCRRQDGVMYHAALTVAPLFEPGEQRVLAGFVSVYRDITPIKEAERLKDEFISNVSHELRTPLSVVTLVSGNLDTLYARLTEEKRQNMIRDIRTHVRVLNDVVEDVLGLSQIDSHAVSMEREPINLAQLVQEEVDKQQPLAQRKTQEVRVSGVDALPVWGNKAQLRQVIRNLVNNAIKYTPKSGFIHCECSTVEGQTRPEQTRPISSDDRPIRKLAAVRISDTGIGVGDQDLPHIFERFYRVKAHCDVPGTGLGLAIANELVKLHGGHLAVASVPEQGSTFTVLLPLWVQEEP